MLNKIKVIGFDADDTLWINEPYFRDAEFKLADLLKPFAPDKDIIEEQLIFYTLENHKKMWRFFDARTYRSGPFDQEYLIGLMEQLL